MAESSAISVSVPALPIFEFQSFHINNSVLATLLVSLMIIVMAVIFRARLQFIPGRFQTFIEMLVEFFLAQLTSAWGSEERARKALPFILSIFFLLLICNQFSLIPLVSSVVKDGVQVLRTPSSDLSLTITLGIMMVIGSHIIALIRHPFRHLGNFFKFHLLFKVRSITGFLNTLLEIFLGLLDIIGEMAKIMSMSFRLFGNIFAGEVMITVMTALIAYGAPMPFILISTFSSLVQAFVFSMLALNFSAGIIRSSEPPVAVKA